MSTKAARKAFQSKLTQVIQLVPTDHASEAHKLHTELYRLYSNRPAQSVFVPVGHQEVMAAKDKIAGLEDDLQRLRYQLDAEKNGRILDRKKVGFNLWTERFAQAFGIYSLEIGILMFPEGNYVFDTDWKGRRLTWTHKESGVVGVFHKDDLRWEFSSFSEDEEQRIKSYGVLLDHMVHELLRILSVGAHFKLAYSGEGMKTYLEMLSIAANEDCAGATTN